MQTKGLFWPLRERSGFSLIELLVSLTVFSFGILGVIGMQMYALRGNSYSWNSTLAQRIAEQKLEVLKAMEYQFAKLATFGDFEANQNNVPAADQITNVGANDSIRVDIEEFGLLKESPGAFYGSAGAAAAAPYDRFKRITIQKIVDSASGTDSKMVIKVIVYWVGTDSDPANPATHRKIAMMGMVAL